MPCLVADRSVRMGAFRKSIITGFFLGLFASLPLLEAQTFDDLENLEDVLTVECVARPDKASPGTIVTLLVKVDIRKGWHIYSMDTTGGPASTKVTVFPGDGYIVLQGVEGPRPKRKIDDGFGVEVGYHTGSPVFRVRVRIASSARERVTLRGELFAQGCSATSCLTPKAYPFSAKVDVTNPSESPAVASSSGKAALPPITGVPEALAKARVIAVGGMTRDEKSFLSFLRGGNSAKEEAESGSLLWILLAGFLAGLAALATPCVYPMIPITVSFFSKLGRERGGRSLAPALVYCFGIVGSFTALGLVLTLLLGASGTQDFSANPLVNALVGLLFVAFSLSLLGMFEIRLPRFLTALGGASAATSGYTAVLLMGLTFAVTSFACTGPFIGAILAGTATEGYLGPTLGMVGFSTALALPFFFLALIPQMLAGLPKSGGWMITVKVVMGFLVLAAAFKFFSNADLVLGWGLLSRVTVVCIFIAIGLGASLYLLGLYRFRHEEPTQSIGAGRLTAALLFLALSLRMAPALFGAGLGELDAFLPPEEPGTRTLLGAAAPTGETIPWISDLDEAVRIARATGKHLFLDFTGHTCSNCKWMQANMFTRPKVIAELKRFVPVELYTDRVGDPFEERNRLLRERKFHSVAVPLYAIVALE